MVILDFMVDHQVIKECFRCVLIEYGELCAVITIGIIKRLMFLVLNWDTIIMVLFVMCFDYHIAFHN